MRGLTLANLRLICLLATALSLTLDGHAQQTEEQTQAEPAENTGSGQVEANEDIYRQFMELKDGLQSQDTTPQESWQSRARLQKLEELPEDSQKHLRNELREIIVAGEAWQPGDEDKEYPYVPSQAALDDRRLQNEEAGAWAELLENYHDREAQIYANAARSEAASVTPGPTAGVGQASTESEGTEPGGGQQPNQADQAASEAADSFAPMMQEGASAGDRQGVAQSAMDFLEQSGYRSGNAQAGQSGQTQSQGTQSQQQGQGQEAQQGQAAARSSAASQSATEVVGMPVPAQAATGAEQSAMQYLQQAGSAENQAGGESGEAEGQAQAADPQELESQVYPAEVQTAVDSGADEASSEGVSQSALEYLSGNEAPDTQSDTLSIEDLLNAGGIEAGPGAEGAEDDEPTDSPEDPTGEKGSGAR